MATTEVGNLGPAQVQHDHASRSLSEFGRLAARIFAVGGLVVVASFFLAQNANAETGGSSGHEADASTTTSPGGGHHSSATGHSSLQKILNSTAHDVRKLTHDLGLEQAVGAGGGPHRVSSSSTSSSSTSTFAHSSAHHPSTPAGSSKHKSGKATHSRHPVSVPTTSSASKTASVSSASRATSASTDKAAPRSTSHDQHVRADHDQTGYDKGSVDQAVEGLIGSILSTGNAPDPNEHRDSTSFSDQDHQSVSRSKTSPHSSKTTKEIASRSTASSHMSKNATSGRSRSKASLGSKTAAAPSASSRRMSTSPVPAPSSAALPGVDRLTRSLGAALVGVPSAPSTTSASADRSARKVTTQAGAQVDGAGEVKGSSTQQHSTDRSAQDAPTGGLLGVVGGVVRPLISDVVDPVVTDVAVPVLHGVVDPVVGRTVQPVLGKTVGPLVGGVVDPVVDNVAAPIVGREVSPALAGVVVTVTHAATGTASASTSPSSPSPSWQQTGDVPGSRTVQLSYEVSYRPALSTGGIDGLQQGSAAQDASAVGAVGLWAVDLGAILPHPAGPTPTARSAALMHGAAHGSTSASTSHLSATASLEITSDTHSPVSQPVSLPMHEQGNHAPAGSTSSAGGGSAASAGLAGIATDAAEGWFSTSTGRGPIHADTLPTGPSFGPGCFPD